MEDGSEDIINLIINLITVLIFYFIPAMVAGKRRHANKGAIILTNLIFGWTVIGWFVALIWASTSNVKPKEA